MKTHIKNFLKRGMMASVGGPIIVIIVYKILEINHIVTEVSVDEMLLAILSSSLLAFIAGGASIIHEFERLPLVIATMIHFAVLFLDYFLIYFINGWITKERFLLFAGIFLTAYVIIWLTVFLFTRAHVKKMNHMISMKN